MYDCRIIPDPWGQCPRPSRCCEETADVPCVCVVKCTLRAMGVTCGMETFGRFCFEWSACEIQSETAGFQIEVTFRDRLLFDDTEQLARACLDVTRQSSLNAPPYQAHALRIQSCPTLPQS